ncbi:hypothetical protein E3E26_02440 [Thermococcus sp. LS1]|uniref:hypothetical protein n=1 Tax=Thermococcus sp. LS1 TaxID=1638259 RepID=UPI00143C6195|nr:hypothetical protein [Thermococcus sp. LS1]NJD98657.1 hypothetical protein [Thermococcus sp. LS1]
MRSETSPRFVFGSLIFLSLFLQTKYFGLWSAIRTIAGSAVAFILMLSICWTGKQLNSQSYRGRITQYIIGYTKLSGAKGKSRQLFALFVGYFALSGLPNLPLVEDSIGFFLSLFPLTTGLIGLTYRWINKRCQKSQVKT